MSRALLIDTDPGIDDALALLLAFASPDCEVAALTTVAGNVPIEAATANAQRLAALAAPGRPPRIARGAAGPLVGRLITAADVHGEDGLGDIGRLREPDGRLRYPVADPPPLEMQDGAGLILETAARLGPDLTVVALGPLTNLALALRRDPAGLARVARVVVMGGAVGVPGNVTAAAEFNIHVDPEAAAEVLAAGLPVELVPLDVTRRCCLTRAALARALGGRRDPVAAFLTDVTAHGFAYADAGGGAGIVMHDPLAVAVALDPTLVRLDALRVDVETRGEHTRGLTLADRRPRAPGRGPAPNCRVALDVDAARFEALFLERVCRASA